jgi:hypothetical protein
VLWTGSAGARAWALGVLQARPELATTRAVLETLQRPEHMHDQYHALVLAVGLLRLTLPSVGRAKGSRRRSGTCSSPMRLAPMQTA